MDYAKYAYLKVKELEDLKTTSNQNPKADTIEFSSGLLNMQVLDISTYACGSVSCFGKTYLQNKLIISASQVGKIQIELLVNNIAVCSEEREVDIGENQFIIMKTYTPEVASVLDISVRIKLLSQNYSCIFVSNMLILWGDVYASENLTAIHTRVLNLSDTTLISYNENQRIFFTDANIKEQSLSQSDFKFLASGISHCFAVHKTTQEIYFFRVDASGNLFYSKYSDIANETKIDEDVSVVFARQCVSACQEDILVCYIKQGKPVFRCMTNNTIGSATYFKLPSGDYTDIDIVDAPELSNMIVVCTHKNLSNYILQSNNGADISNFVETLNSSCFFTVKRYARVFGDTDNTLSALKTNILFTFKKTMVNYQDFLNNKTVGRLSAKINATTSIYAIAPEVEVNYSLSFEQTQKYVEGEYRVAYGGDCANWQPATYNLLGDGSLNDPSNILSKWPFNLIKPCLINKGEFLGYLNPNDYSLFEDGSPADITNTDYDVMVEFPKIYYKISTDWDGVISITNCTKLFTTIEISNKPKEGYVCYSHMRKGVVYDKIYVSAYENFCYDKILHGCSGAEAKSHVNHEEVFHNITTYRNSQYTTLNYHFTTYLQLLGLLLFKEYNGKNTYGNGAGTNTNCYKPTGLYDKAGMYYGVLDDNLSGHKIFGLENVFNNSTTHMDGMLIDNDYGYLLYDPTNPDCELNFLGTNYKKYVLELQAKPMSGYVQGFYADTAHGFLPIMRHALKSQGQPYYFSQMAIHIAEDYYYPTDVKNLPLMIMSYGGRDVNVAGSLFVYQDCQNYYLGNHSERLICYPNLNN